MKFILKKCGSIILPVTVKKQLHNFYTLAMTYGQYKTIRRWDCTNEVSGKIPWYTYPAIEYLDNIDFSDKVVFEYGSGNSSAYWAKKAKFVYSIEHNKEWYEKITPQTLPNQIIQLCESQEEYLAAIENIPEKIDVIIIDGMYREECSKIASNFLAPNGIIILDNADWYKETSKYLRESLDLLEVDFHGFGPINAYTWTTSIFFTRSARPRPLNNTQPHYSMAAIKNGDDEKFI